MSEIGLLFMRDPGGSHHYHSSHLTTCLPKTKEDIDRRTRSAACNLQSSKQHAGASINATIRPIFLDLSSYIMLHAQCSIPFDSHWHFPKQRSLTFPKQLAKCIQSVKKAVRDGYTMMGIRSVGMSTLQSSAKNRQILLARVLILKCIVVFTNNRHVHDLCMTTQH